MTDKEYRQCVNDTLKSHKYYIQLVKNYRISVESKKRTWLLLLGLAETWDIMHDR